MRTTTAVRSRILTTDRDADQARDVLRRLDGPTGLLAVGQVDQDTVPVPHDVGVTLHEVLRAIASGSTITVTTTPREVTTTTAAAMLGISRPTLMKMVKDGRIPAHKVGTHTRLLAADIAAAKRTRRERERAAFAALLEAEDDE